MVQHLLVGSLADRCYTWLFQWYDIKPTGQQAVWYISGLLVFGMLCGLLPWLVVYWHGLCPSGGLYGLLVGCMTYWSFTWSTGSVRAYKQWKLPCGRMYRYDLLTRMLSTVLLYSIQMGSMAYWGCM